MFVSHDAFSKCGYRWAWILSLSASIGTFGQLKAFDVGWRKPLSTKEREIEANILQRHNILGLYPSMVEVPIDGSSVDITTSAPFSDAVHAVAWTSHYLAGASYRYAWLRQSGADQASVDQAKLRADEIFEAVYPVASGSQVGVVCWHVGISLVLDQLLMRDAVPVIAMTGTRARPMDTHCDSVQGPVTTSIARLPWAWGSIMIWWQRGFRKNEPGGH